MRAYTVVFERNEDCSFRQVENEEICNLKVDPNVLPIGFLTTTIFYSWNNTRCENKVHALSWKTYKNYTFLLTKS